MFKRLIQALNNSVAPANTDPENQIPPTAVITQPLHSEGHFVQPEHATSSLSFGSAQWIWTSELSDGNAPIGSRGFRKTFVYPEGKTPDTLEISFAADDRASLWVNGDHIIDQVGWTNPAVHGVSLQSRELCALLIAFNATNNGGPAGLLVDAQVTYTDGSTSPIVSDGSWRASVDGAPDGFQYFSFDDSTWDLVKTQSRS
ncbi:hypothetical protein GYMLUDRAFT_750854 [Collybiopsis luxurians FD-317 M1]|uniref:Uncharacterized protein n=1 Tax=Collybiopsis luxurians FD-317 M1 TaxID=944289 RepID=A0A0D0BQQ3_9AGAR|nr:hypothetical protein GYMLUDRAFT_750854 [Collybiopsis luxurians FD-317 M1]